VPDRAADAGAVRAAIEAACAHGLDVAVASGTHLENVDGQLAARPQGPGELHLLLNRGSEVFRVDADGVHEVERRVASAAEEAALDRAAALTVERLRAQGVHAEVVAQRLNRRKIDLIPLPEWADPPKARLAELLAAVQARLHAHGLRDLRAAVELSEAAAAEAGLADPRVTSDAKHVEIGLTDKSDSAKWYYAHEWLRGVAPAQVLVVGDELGPLGGLPGSDSLLMAGVGREATVVSVGPEPAGVPAGVLALGGGPARFAQLLDAQLAARVRGALPESVADPEWTVRVEGVDPERERARESLLALVDGRAGTRGSLLTPHPASTPDVLLAGAYRGRGERSELAPAPLWNRLAPHRDGAPRGEGAPQGKGAPQGAEAPTTRTLDLHTGLLHHQGPGALEAVQLSSLARPGVAALRVCAPLPALRNSPPLTVPPGVKVGEDGDGEVARMHVALARGALEAAAIQEVRDGGEPAGGQVDATTAGEDETGVLERFAAYAVAAGDGAHEPAPTRAAHAVAPEDEADEPAPARVRRARAAGFERLLCEHRSAWAQRWEAGDVRIAGDPALQRAVRLALYHLWGAAGDGGEAAVGARGLTGGGYRGHVFWDADVFVLPFLAATHPAAAKAVLEYRVRRLPAARRTARAAGRAGARFAWESALTGADVTPRSARDPTGRVVEIHTGEREEHVVADVAWAAACYVEWTGDEAFRAGPGRRLWIETARYWASRVERDGDGRAHIRGVIGPDEYHEDVDDNAYTNVMARWNLRRAYAESAGAGAGVAEAERATWAQTAEALVDGYQPQSGLYEECAGFFALEPLVIAELVPHRPVAADLLLSPERVAGAQVVKQADTLMLHHLVPEEVAPGSLAANLAYYEPRTAHGSSLSPGVHAALLARVGRVEEAHALLELTARIDLDDISQSTAGGVHLAAMGTVWQALVYGFAGARPRGEVLHLDPRLPDAWGELEVRLRFRDARLRVVVRDEELEVRSDRPVAVSVAGGEPVTVGPDGHREPR
jgi:trehalose/maltose hydrolase-like predicted phosphorylase